MGNARGPRNAKTGPQDTDPRLRKAANEVARLIDQQVQKAAELLTLLPTANREAHDDLQGKWWSWF